MQFLHEMFFFAANRICILCDFSEDQHVIRLDFKVTIIHKKINES